MKKNENTEEYVYMHAYIKSWPFILYWEADVVLIFITIFVLGYVFAQGLTLLMFVAAAFGAVYFYQKSKRVKAKGYLNHQAYKHGLRTTKKVIPSDEKIFIGG